MSLRRSGYGVVAVTGGVVFGAAACLCVRIGLRVPLPGTSVYTDPRETFVLLGAALYGPWAALIAGLLAGLGEHSRSLMAWSSGCHALSALGAACGYARLTRRHAPRRRPGWFLASWAGLVAGYYYLGLVPVGVLAARCSGAVWATVFGAGTPWAAAAMMLARGMAVEAVFTASFTTAVLWALPRQHRGQLARAR